MAEENRPFIGYRSAGRRPESQQDRRAAADAPLSALRGMVSGVLGAPGDIESLIRMLPGLSERTVLPTSEDIEKRLPMRELNQTPTGRAFTTAGQLGGGFYTGPGSPLRAVAALPSAVSRAGRDFAMAAGQPAVNVVKPKGGNWLAGSVERAVEPMRAAPRPGQTTRQLAEMMPANEWIGLSDEAGQVSDYVRSLGGGKTEQLSAPDFAMNRWLDTKLGKYMKNEMATPEDPVRALAERGITHTEIQPTGYNVATPRSFAGFPEEGLAKSPEAKLWEDKSDTFVNQLMASDITSQYPKTIEENPWLLKVPPETRVYDMLRGAEDDLGFGHLVDELRNAINPASGLPENLLWKYSDLDKVTVPQAVERVAKINDWRAAQKAEADMARAMNPATQVVKEYPDQGMKWVELRQPEITAENLPPGYEMQTFKNNMGGTYYSLRDINDGGVEIGAGMSPELAIKSAAKKIEDPRLEDALKYEGETMGHCVGGYCPDVVEGRSKIYSLRDDKGRPHVTIEVQPWRSSQGESLAEFEARLRSDPMRSEQAVRDIMSSPQYRDSIVQIKGKGNKAPKEDYLPAVQDFVRSGNFGKVGDLGNAGLADITKYDDRLKQAAQEAYGSSRFLTNQEMDALMQSQRDAGFSRGGAVQGYAAGGLVAGANFPTGDFDPARIDAMVSDLYAMNTV
jgi:hypothetical protein